MPCAPRHASDSRTWRPSPWHSPVRSRSAPRSCATGWSRRSSSSRSEEHTSELQSQSNLVCRLLLEKKKKTRTAITQQLIHKTRDHIESDADDIHVSQLLPT